MKQITLLFAIMAVAFCMAPQQATAQNYRNALGFRFGYPFGLTYKHMFKETSAFEGIVGVRGRSVEFVGLYEYHFYPARRAKEFDVYVGGGGHVGFYGTYVGRDNPPYNRGRGPYYRDGRPYWAYNDPYLGFGLDFIAGCSYTFKNAPINLGFDYKPAISLFRHYGFWYGDAAISVRFVL